jgi:hypothetical protein
LPLPTVSPNPHPVILSEAAPRILRAAESKDLRLLLHLPSSSPNPHPVILSEAAPRILRAAESKDLRLLLHLFLALQLFLWTHSPLPKHLHWHSPLLTQIHPARILPLNQPIFFTRDHPFNCFSRAIAFCTNGCRSNHTNQLQLYFIECPSNTPFLCCQTRDSISLVIPT